MAEQGNMTAIQTIVSAKFGGIRGSWSDAHAETRALTVTAGQHGTLGSFEGGYLVRLVLA